MPRLTLIAAAIFIGACASSAEPPPPEPEPVRARAALATVHVDNRSAHSVSVSYRLAARPASEVGVGSVAAGGFVTLAPVPAGEPLLLVARLATGAELSIPARAFDINGEWTWTIHADARFIRPNGGQVRK